MSDPPLIPGALYGLRTWRVTADLDGERLAAAHRDTLWPCGEDPWLRATCGATQHVAPQAECSCGIHAWHPRRASARHVLAGRFDVPGIVEATGAIEVHEEGFRAARARPYALVVAPGRNAKLAARLAARHGAEVVEVRGADDLLAWCRDRGLGLDAQVVDEMLGPDAAGAHRQARRRKTAHDRLRIAAAVALAAGLLGGALVAADPPGHDVFGRTGHVHRP